MNADLAAILRNDLHVPATLIDGGTTLADAGLDSLAHVELSVILRDKLGVDVTDTEVKDAGTLANLDRMVTDRRAGR